jgi:SH3-like domain-containing protein
MMIRPLRLAAACLATAWAALASTAVHAQQMVSIARDGVNMRAGAGTRHAVNWELAKGYPLRVTARQGQWLKVTDFENDTGWVYRPMTGRTPHHIVSARVANIRSAPSTRARIVGRAEHGEVLRTLAKREGWVKVQQDAGVSGWVSRPLLWGW